MEGGKIVRELIVVLLTEFDCAADNLLPGRMPGQMFSQPIGMGDTVIIQEEEYFSLRRAHADIPLIGCTAIAFPGGYEANVRISLCDARFVGSDHDDLALREIGALCFDRFQDLIQDRGISNWYDN